MRAALHLTLVVVLAACGGGSSKPAATPSNSTGTGTADATSTKEPPGDARVVQRTQAGGVIELAGERSGSLAKAQVEMEAHCGPGNYTITQEGEELIGSDSISSAAGGPAQTTRTETAWRVHYQCAGAAPLPPP